MKPQLIIPVVLVVLLGLLGSMFVVREGQVGLVLNLGRVARTDLAPGLHFKIPLIETARVFDRRFQANEFPPERSLTSERKDVSVDFVAIGFIVVAGFREAIDPFVNAVLWVVLRRLLLEFRKDEACGRSTLSGADFL